MTAPAAPFTVRRLLVALDASPQSLAALAAAAGLAARTGADVLGLFVEDVDILRLAGQTAARLVDEHSAALRTTDVAEMERTLHALAVRARRALAEAARREGVPWSFRVARGRVAAEIVAAARDADLVCLGGASWGGGRGARLGATASLVLDAAPAAVLLVRGPEPGPGTPAVVFDGGAPARRALAAAAALSQRDGGRLVVLLTPGGDARRERLRGEAVRMLEGAGVGAEFRDLPDASPEAVARALAADAGAFLVLPMERAASADAPRNLLSHLRRPVLVVR